MADTVLFEFLHSEMVAELWAHDPDPGPGVSAGFLGEEAWAAVERLDRGPEERGEHGSGPGRNRTPPLPRSATWGAHFLLCRLGVSAWPALQDTSRIERDSSG